ncbi:hypothetical protein GEV33_006231 [Tenebrio molitor]|uniref:Uncharacterized protein n=1 Tax=Tenebrio molitor TaxID=7067 RepID=A0A8J6LDD2_TENMO|nr:hypothetical protein GEV33_006231 [Tenebrio molitor]
MLKARGKLVVIYSNSFSAALAGVPDSSKSRFVESVKPIVQRPYFDDVGPRNVTAVVGQSALLNCRVKHPGDRTVTSRYKRETTTSRASSQTLHERINLLGIVGLIKPVKWRDTRAPFMESVERGSFSDIPKEDLLTLSNLRLRDGTEKSTQ